MSNWWVTRVVGFLSLALSLTAANMAAAQEEATEEAGDAVEAEAGMSADSSTAAEPEAEQSESTSRFRWGVSGFGGPLLLAYTGGGFGVDARFGVQLNQTLAIYGQPVLAVAVAGASSSSSSGASASTSVAGLYGLGAMVDATLGDLFYVAGGPELLLGGIGSASVSVNGQNAASTVEAKTGPFFSIATRAGFAFGSKRPDRRKGFTIGLDMRLLFAGDAVLLPLIALGYEAF